MTLSKKSMKKSSEPSCEETLISNDKSFGKNSPPLNVSNEKAAAKREIARWYRIFKTYGITKEQYDELDGGRCPICLRDWSPRVRPCVDHDHHTGEVRGVVCLYCNHRIIGRHRDPDLLARVSDYLRRSTGYIVPPKPKRKRVSRKKKI